jgi:hypothetical protein
LRSSRGSLDGMALSVAGGFSAQRLGYDFDCALTGLVGTMPSEVSIVGAHDDRDPTVEELKREFAEVREQQGATKEILAAISSSPTDPRDVFEKIAASAARLCGAYDALIFELVGDQSPNT